MEQLSFKFPKQQRVAQPARPSRLEIMAAQAELPKLQPEPPNLIELLKKHMGWRFVDQNGEEVR